MQFLTITALLPALALATTYRGVGKDQSPVSGYRLQSANAGIAEGENECGISTFKKSTSGKSPTVDDCKALTNMIRDDQEWNVHEKAASIVHYGTCSFVVQTRGGDAEIGNADVIDLVNDSIRQFQEKGTVNCEGQFPLYVGASGTMPCEELKDDKKRVTVDWTIVHSGDEPKGGYKRAFRA